MHYTIAVSNHPRAVEEPPSEVAAASWQVLYDGPTYAEEARRAAQSLTSWYRFVRLFRGRNAGQLIGTYGEGLTPPA